MRPIPEQPSISALITELITREEESIALYESALHSIGDSPVSPVLHRLIGESRRNKRLLEQTLEDVNEQCSLDEAIV